MDDEDGHFLSSYRWSTSGSYAMCVTAGRTLYLHRLILGALAESREVDHINGNRLDNRRSNLRPATRSQNAANQARRSDNRSGFKGVGYASRQAGSKKWRARVHRNGKQVWVAYFATPEEAAKAYDAKASEVHGEFCRPNGER